MKSVGKKILRGALFIVIIAVIIVAVYLGKYYHTQVDIDSLGNSKVSISKEDYGYFIDGPGTESALIFYPGAKVDEKAYGPLMSQIAAGGVDCFLVKMPVHMAILDMDKAEDIMDEYNYDNWYLSGHSQGGAAAAIYVAQNPDNIDGLILLAAYPTKKISDDISMISIYGDRDKVVQMDRYDFNKSNWPAQSREVIIPGGNHAGYANYGEQAGDGEAQITNDEQQSITAQTILDFVKSSNAE
ncbi:MAG: alpha/beta fold hydrolase [Lachnospiraceae bacterium]|nr:alpha/beta fold hydrolase [Lachnospiraceae bacterium]